MARTKLEDLGFTLKENGKVDFSRPPKGKRFVPIPTDEEYIKACGIDRRFVTRHKFSATTMLVVMELIDEEDAPAADAYIADIKAECHQEERKNRCKIVSPKTGREIYCPESISCCSDRCPMKLGQAVRTGIPECLDDMAETVKSENWSSNPVEDEVVTKIMWSDFKAKLRRSTPVLAKIVEMEEHGYRADEIMAKLGRRKDETSWYYYQWKRIRDRWKEYNKE